MKKITTLLLMVFTNVYFLTAQNILWSKNYGGSGDDEARAIQQTSDGGYIVAGYSKSTDGDVSGNHGDSDFWILRLDADGDTLWTKCYGGSASDMVEDMQQTTDGGFVLAGQSSSTDGDVWGNHGDDDFWILRLDAAGDTLWTKCYGGSSWDDAKAIQQTTDSGFVVAGVTYSTDGDVWGNHGDWDIWILRLDTLGDTLWTKCYGGSGRDWIYDIRQTIDSGFVVAGYSSSTDDDVSGNHGDYDYWILRLDTLGDILWSKSYGGSDEDRAYAIQQTTDSEFVVAGYSQSTDGDVSGNHGNEDYWILHLDTLGDILWTKSYGGSGDDEASAIQQTSDGGFIVAGYSSSTDGDVQGNQGSYDYWVLRLDVAGDTVWSKSYGGSEDDGADVIQQTTDGGFVVAGWSYSTDGDVPGNHGDYDYWILRLDNGNITGVPTQQLSQNVTIYPNPANNKLTVIANGTKQFIAKIYTLHGQLLLQETITPETSAIDISKLAEGLYILKLTGSTETTVAKFVKE